MGLVSKTEEVFCEDVFDVQMIKKVCFGGVEKKYRALAWRILLGTVGLRRKSHQKEIKLKDRKYLSLFAGINSFCNNDRSEITVNGVCNVSSGASKVDASGKTSNDDEMRGLSRVESFLCTFNKTCLHVFEQRLPKKIVCQIDIDIKRINTKYRMHFGTDISHMYNRILMLIAHRRPSLGYVQGMADILIPFILIFSEENVETAESSSYFCYSRLLDEIQHNIIDLQETLIKKLDFIIMMEDLELYEFLRTIGLETHMFAFRWFNCFFVREFKFPALYKILDTMFASDNIEELMLFFSAALLMKFKRVLIRNDFSNNVLFLQSIYEREWEDAEIELLLSSAKFYRSITNDNSRERWINKNG